MNKQILILLFLFSCLTYSQSGFEDWDKSYILGSPEKIIQQELLYAKKVDNNEIEGKYYVAMNKFRFIAEFTGNEREIKPEVINSMKTVFKIKTGKSGVLDGLVSKEFEFKIGSSKIWMPIQNQLMKPFRDEIKKESKVLLYCLFSNEHKYTGEVINAFLISEFTMKWK